tara:strand:+ start:967 stop:1587 length:621 start_codon:yes stop_codon:yes gene_type:complete
MKVELKDINLITPYENNPRRKRDIEKVAKSINEFGWQQPIVIDKNNVIIVGHSRYEAAKMLEYKSVPVVIADLTPEKAKAYRIADNKTNEYSSWDFTILHEEFSDLLKTNYDLDKLGFEKHELDSIISFKDSDNKWLDPEKEWQDMPEYAHEDLKPFRSIIVHFLNKEDLDRFCQAIIQDISKSAKYIYYPKNERNVLKDKGYESE